MRIFMFCLLAVVVLMAALVIQPQSAKTDAKNNHGMPWQVVIDHDQSTVFGLTLANDTLNSSTLSDAIEQLGTDNELAVLAKPEQLGALELFYPRFRTGPLQGKLIIGIDAPEAEITAIKQAPSQQEYLDNGTKKFQLTTQQQFNALTLAIKSLTFAPSARLDDTLIRARFGKPAAIINVNEQVSYYIYEQLGLTVRIDIKGKDMVHYVSPVAIPKLIEALQIEAKNIQEKLSST